MIEVSVTKNHIAVHGHARAAPVGQDIICAGASTLAQTLIRSIEDLTEDTISYDISPGMVDIHYEELSEVSRTLVDSFFIGMCMLADAYPDYVRIN